MQDLAERLSLAALCLVGLLVGCGDQASASIEPTSLEVPPSSAELRKEIADLWAHPGANDCGPEDRGISFCRSYFLRRERRAALMRTLCERAEPASEDRLFCLQQWIYDLTSTEEGLLLVEPYWEEVSAVWPDSRSARVVANQRALFADPRQPAPYPEP